MTRVVDHIARRLNVTADEAGALLRDFVEAFRAELETIGTVSLQGLGTFRRDGGEVHFIPEPRLATVVNHRFAGLYPLPVDSHDDASLGLDSAYGIPDVPIAADLLSHVGDDSDEGIGADEGYGEDRADHDAATSAPDDPEALEKDPVISDAPYHDSGDEGEQPRDLDEIIAAAGAPPWAQTGDLLESVREEVEGDSLSDVADAASFEAEGRDDAIIRDEPGTPDHSEETIDNSDVDGSEDASRGDDAPDESTGLEGRWNRPARFTDPDAGFEDDDVDTEAEAAYEEPEEGDDFGGELIHPVDLSADEAGAAADDDQTVLPASEADPEVEPPAEPSSDPPIVVRRSPSARPYWLAIPLLIIAIAVVLWMLRQSERNPIVPDVTTEQGPVEEADPSMATEVAPPPAEQWSPGTVDRRAGGYTIVVSSQASRREALAFAESLAGELLDESLPIDVFQGTADGRPRYRVGVGQFETIEAAALAMERLSAQLPRGVWILRIRRNM